MGSGAASSKRPHAQSTKNGRNSDQTRNTVSAKRTPHGKHVASQNSASLEEQKMAIVLFFIVALYLGLFASGFL